jgi:CarboxypepD_reg-like domain
MKDRSLNIHSFCRSRWRPTLAFPFILFLSCIQVAVAADIKGTVTNALGGEPLSKVQVALLGTSFLVATAPDGSFQISSIPAGSYVLQVSCIGYRTLSVPFHLAAEESKEFELTLTPDNFRRTDVIEVRGDVFEPKDWPAVGDLTLTSSELQQTSTVLANDPFRSLQALPGVSASANNEFLAQFSVMGAPYEQVGIYVDDVLVPNLLHSVASFPDAPTLCLLTGNDVEDLQLMPVAYPVRYGDGSGAALAIRTRSGSEGAPLFHASVGLADSEFLGEGGFGKANKGTWLIDGRKSYIGYLERLVAGSRFSQDGFYDADLKFTYDLTPTQTFSFLATGGSLGINDPKLSAAADPNELKNGTNDLVVTRLGWRWTPRSNLLLDAHSAYVSTRFEETNGADTLINRSLDREWSGGANLSWSWHPLAILQAGYSVRQPRQDFAGNSFIGAGQPPAFFSFHTVDVRQDAYVQHSAQLWRDRIRVEGGLRWARLDTLRVQPLTGQVSLAFQPSSHTQIEAGWGSYAQLPSRGGVLGLLPVDGVTLGFAELPRSSLQYLVGIEQRFGERTRVRVEAFDRQNEQREDIYLLPSRNLLRASTVVGRDYSRGLQFILQRRSENRLSGWIGYTLTYALSRSYSLSLPPPIGSIGLDTGYLPTLQDQRHTFNLFGSYRMTSSLRFSLKLLYGSGFPVSTFPQVLHLGPYERLDLRADKSWLFRKWKLSLYGELLNATNHNNRRFAGLASTTGPSQVVVLTNDGLPVTPTVGLAFDF